MCGVIVACSILSVMGPWNKMIFSLPASTLYGRSARAGALGTKLCTASSAREIVKVFHR